MGNTSTKEKIDQLDGGQLLPHGIYTGTQDYDFRIVQRLILQRKIAPFYKGLEDCEDSEDAQEERRQQQQKQQQRNSLTTAASSSAHSGTSSLPSNTSSNNSSSYGGGGHVRSSSSSNNSAHNNSHNAPKGHSQHNKVDIGQLYQGAIECPICFLYYPRNINRTRCCDKPICTECFVQIKRHESSPTETPACPYCVEPHFGILYTPIPALFQLSSPGAQSPLTFGGASMSASSSHQSMSGNNKSVPNTHHTTSTSHLGASSSPSGAGGEVAVSPGSPSGTTRRKSTSHKSPEVVLADDLRPDWNRRILAAVQRQPGSRRASTSSSSGGTLSLGRRLVAGSGSGRSGGGGSTSSGRRSNSAGSNTDYAGYLTAMRHMGTDIEELMIMEAMRQSLQDEQNRQQRVARETREAAIAASQEARAAAAAQTAAGQGAVDSGSPAISGDGATAAVPRRTSSTASSTSSTSSSSASVSNASSSDASAVRAVGSVRLMPTLSGPEQHQQQQSHIRTASSPSTTHSSSSSTASSPLSSPLHAAQTRNIGEQGEEAMEMEADGDEDELVDRCGAVRLQAASAVPTEHTSNHSKLSAVELDVERTNSHCQYT